MAAKKKKKNVSNPARAVATTSIPSKVRETGKAVSDDTAVCDTLERATINSVSTDSRDTPASEDRAAEKLLVDMSNEELEHHLAQAELQNFVDQYDAKSQKEASRQAAKLVNERRLSRQAADRLQYETWLNEDLITSIFDADAEAPDQKHSIDLTDVVRLPRDESETLATIWTLHQVLRFLELPSLDAALRFVLERWSSVGLIQSNDMLLGLEEALTWYARNSDLEDILQYDKIDQQLDDVATDRQKNVLTSGMLQSRQCYIPPIQAEYSIHYSKVVCNGHLTTVFRILLHSQTLIPCRRQPGDRWYSPKDRQLLQGTRCRPSRLRHQQRFRGRVRK